MRLMRLIKTEPNAPRHHERGLSGCILKSVISEIDKGLSPEQKQ